LSDTEKDFQCSLIPLAWDKRRNSENPGVFCIGFLQKSI